MTTFTFDRNYHNKEQVRWLMPAYLARYEELKAAGKYPYNDDFRGYLGIEAPGHVHAARGACGCSEDTAIYLCQCLRRDDELAEKVRLALDDGYVAIDSVTLSPMPCSSIVEYSESGWHEWRDARLIEPASGGLAVLPKGHRTRGHFVTGKVLVKVAS